MQCKGCQGAIDDDQYRLVAEWPFCLTCFEELTAPKPARPKSEPARGEVEGKRAPESEREPGSKRAEKKYTACIACEQPIRGDDAAPFGICAKCRTGLIADPFRKLLEQEAREQAVRAQVAAEAEAAAASDEPTEIVPVGVLGKKTCAQCGRRLLEPGGYHVIDGQWFCPPCANEAREKSGGDDEKDPPPAVPAIPPAWAKPVPVPRVPPSPPSTPGGASVTVCDACERPFAPGHPEAVEGFLLCQPCVKVDVEEALDLARTRHRAKLRKLKETLAG